MRCVALIISAILLSLAVVGCKHKEILCPGSVESVVNVQFEWDKASGADPAGMTLYFFPLSEGGKIWRFDIAGSKGGAVQIPTGEYSMLAFNNNLPTVRFTDELSYYGFRGEALKVSGGDFLASIGMLYGSVTPYLEVTPCGVRYKTESGGYKECSRSLVRCYPDSLTTLFNVSVRNVKGIERVRKTQAYIDGVGSCVIMNNASVSGIPSAVTFPMTVHAQKKEFTAVAGAFADTQCGGKFTLTLVVTRTDGEVVAKKFDVTAQIENQPHTHNVDIVIDGLEIPEGEVSDDPDIGGIQVGVDGWTTFEVELDTGGIIRL